MYFSKKMLANSRVGQDQWADVAFARNAANDLNKVIAFNSRLAINEAIIPQDVYRDFDNTTVEVMTSDDGDTFLNDLLGLSVSVSIGKLVQQFRQASDAGFVQSSLSGQTGVKMDQVEFSYDGSVIPVHDAGFFRNWREWNAQSSEGFDALIDDQRETVKSVRRHYADAFLDGHVDSQGSYINVDGFEWQGVRNDSRVAQFNLGASGLNFDFTDTSKTGAEIKAAFIAVRDELWINNNCEMDATYYVSRQIASNFERKFSTQYDAKIIMQELADLMGVAAIKVSSKMVGNEMFGMVLSRDKVRVVTGMGINTVAMPRQFYNSDYKFTTWGAAGYQVRTDYNGNTCVIYAADMG